MKLSKTIKKNIFLMSIVPFFYVGTLFSATTTSTPSGSTTSSSTVTKPQTDPNAATVYPNATQDLNRDLKLDKDKLDKDILEKDSLDRKDDLKDRHYINPSAPNPNPLAPK